MDPAKQTTSDFVVETKGRCFLCLSQISPNFNLEPKLKETSVVHSLQSLSRCLRMDMRKVFSLGGGPVSLPLLEKVQRAKLKAELCEGCGSTNEKFSEAYRQLERMQIEVTSWLELILLKMTRAKEIMRSEKVHKSAELISEGKMQIVEVLREEAMEKCSSRTSIRFRPRVKIQMLTSQQIREEMLNVQCNFPKEISQRSVLRRHVDSSSEPVLDPSAHRPIKIEQPSDSNLTMADPDGNNDWMADDFDNQTNSDPLEDEIKTDEAKNEEVEEGAKQSKIKSSVSSPSWKSKSHPRKKEKVLLRDKCTTDGQTNRYKCRVCLKEFNTQLGFYSHYKTVHINVLHTCPICGKTFVQRNGYTFHMKVVHDHFRFKCQKCNRNYNNKNSLIRHQQTSCKLLNNRLLTSNCHLCGKGFPGEHSLKKHMNTVHLKSEGEFPCDLCEEKFENKEILNTHRRSVHVGDLWKLTMSNLGVKLGRN